MATYKNTTGFWNNLFSLEKLVTKNILSVVWVLIVSGGLITICVSIAVAIFTGITDSYGSDAAGAVLVTTLLSAVGIMLTSRVVIEYLIVFFKIHESLVEIQQSKKDTLTEGNATPALTAKTSTVSAPPLPQ